MSKVEAENFRQAHWSYGSIRGWLDILREQLSEQPSRRARWDAKRYGSKR